MPKVFALSILSLFVCSGAFATTYYTKAPFDTIYMTNTNGNLSGNASLSGSYKVGDTEIITNGKINVTNLKAAIKKLQKGQPISAEKVQQSKFCENGFWVRPENTGNKFKFRIGAKGEYTIDWGDGTVETREVKEFYAYHGYSNGGETFAHEYQDSATSYKVCITGKATEYYTPNSPTKFDNSYPAISFNIGTSEKIKVNDTNEVHVNNIMESGVKEIGGSLGNVFPTLSGVNPQFRYTFYGSSQLKTIPADLFAGISGTTQYDMFAGMFEGTGLTEIPADLFKGFTGWSKDAFVRTFAGTQIRSIPADLFAYGKEKYNEIGVLGMFNGTFRDCLNLRAIPANLFSNVDKYYNGMFVATFSGDTALTTIPNGLFRHLSGSGAAADMCFLRTFENCTGLKSGLTADMFGNITDAFAESMFHGTFEGCSNLAGRIPVGLFGTETCKVDTSAFEATFKGCSNLMGGIPGALFGTMSGDPANKMFKETFYGCSGLTGSIPGNLFGNLSGGDEDTKDMFKDMFAGCSKLTGTVPADLFSGITGYKPMTQKIFDDIFSGTGLNIGTQGKSCTETLNTEQDTSETLVCYDNTGLGQYPVGKKCVGYYTSEGEYSGSGSCDGCSRWEPINSDSCKYIACNMGYKLSGTDCVEDTSAKECVEVKPETLYVEVLHGTLNRKCTTVGYRGTDDKCYGNVTCTDTELSCDSGYFLTFDNSLRCTNNTLEEESKLDGSFTVVPAPHGDTFHFQITAAGKFKVDWGDDTEPDVINREEITWGDGSWVTHKYKDGKKANEHTVKISGRATEYQEAYYDGAAGGISFAISRWDCNVDTCSSKDEQAGIKSISGHVGSVFGTLSVRNGQWYGAQPSISFRFNTDLTEVPSDLFDGIYGLADNRMFMSMFEGTGLKKIPAGLFSGIWGGVANQAFYETFRDCKNLENIETDGNGVLGCMLHFGVRAGAGAMFDTKNAGVSAFERTFYGCSKLKTIPSDVFGNIAGTPRKSAFSETFMECSSVAEIPSGLFKNISGKGVASGMFYGTFRYMIDLETIPQGLFANINIIGDEPRNSDSVFMDTFAGDELLKAIPDNLFGLKMEPIGDDTFLETFYGCESLAGEPAKINGTYIHEIWPDRCKHMYELDTKLDGYDDFKYPSHK